MLKLADHDSMSGENVGTTPRMIVTSGKSSIFPWESPEKSWIWKAMKIPKGGKNT